MRHLNIKHFPSNKHFYLTKEGLDELRAKLDNLRRERTLICKELMDMDPKEKTDHILSTDAIKMLEINESEVTEIDDVLQHSSPVMQNNATASDVKLGSTVSLRFGDQVIEYKLVDSIEADPLYHKISEDSPLGRALIGRHPHEKISFLAPKGKRFTYEVDAII